MASLLSSTLAQRGLFPGGSKVSITPGLRAQNCNVGLRELGWFRACVLAPEKYIIDFHRREGQVLVPVSDCEHSSAFPGFEKASSI